MRTSLLSTLVIAHTTLLEAVRNRVLLVALFFTLALVGLSVSAAAVSMGEEARLIVDVGLAAVSGIGTLMAIALAVASFGRELERHTAYPVLARPLSRWAFVLGKFGGVLGAMVGVVALMMTATALVVWLDGASLPRAFWPSLYLAALEMSVVVSVAILFSCYTGPVLAATFSAGVILAGNFARDLHTVSERLLERGQTAAALFTRLVYHLVPDVQSLSLRTQAANDLPVPPAFLGWATVYGLAYAAAALALAMVIFERRRSI